MQNDRPLPAPRRATVAFAALACLAPLPLLGSCSSGGGGEEAPTAVAAPLLTGYTDNPVSYPVGQPIVANQPQFSGSADAWSVVPALPSGLTLDPLTGVVTGQPDDEAASASYTVTATGPEGSDSLDLVIEVVPDPTVGSTEMASRSATGEPGNGGSNQPTLTADGRKTVFDSFATNLIAGDTNGRQDIFLRDNVTGLVERINLGENGQAVNDGNSDSPSVDLDGRVVAFASFSDDLSASDSNGRRDVYVRDLSAGTTELVSANTVGVAANGDSSDPSVADDGGSVAFTSTATDLVPGDTNGDADIFVRDRGAGTTVRVSVTNGGGQSNDGSFQPARASDVDVTAFSSVATNLVAGDGNGVRDVFYRDGVNGTTVRVSVSSAGVEGNASSSSPAISANGRFIVFTSFASNLVAGDTNGVDDIFWHDRVTQTTERVSVSSSGTQSDGQSRFASVSDDGRYVTFDSLATNLVADDTNAVRDIFRHDRQTGETVRVSVATNGGAGSEQSFLADSAADGQSAVFLSKATEFDGVTGGQNQVFVRVLPVGVALAAEEPQAGGLELAPAGGVAFIAPGDLTDAVKVTRCLALSSEAEAPESWSAVVDGAWDWVHVVPSSGRLAPGERVELTVELRPGGLPAGLHSPTLRLLDLDGATLVSIPIEVFVR